jgi:hypothetical protein
MSVTDELESLRTVQLKENCNVEKPASLAMLASRVRSNLRNMFIPGFTRVRGR